MNAQQAENLRVLIRHMEAQNPALGMSHIHECGTPSCAWGHALYIRELAAQGLTVSAPDLWTVFGNDTGGIFCPAGSNPWGRNQVTGQEWATAARWVLTERGYSVDSTPARVPDAFAAFMAKLQEPVAVTA